VIGTGMIANIGLKTVVDLQDSDPAGAASVWSTLEAVGAVFGLGLIVWFAWLGVVMIRAESPATSRAVKQSAPTTSG
jgi:UPF0716 family protein affecting phage T7 exclusion